MDDARPIPVLGEILADGQLYWLLDGLGEVIGKMR